MRSSNTICSCMPEDLHNGLYEATASEPTLRALVSAMACRAAAATALSAANSSGAPGSTPLSCNPRHTC